MAAVADFSKLLQEWDYEKNTLLPTEITTGSNKKAWWKCSRGHSWEAVVVNRVSGTGCPYCSGRFPIKGETDLATTHPELLAEWDYERNTILPTEVSMGSQKKIWWKCKHGHSWKATVNNRTGGSNRCPYCAGKKVWPGFNDLATTHPKLAAQWDFEKNSVLPSEVSAGSNKKVWWKCEHGHSWEAIIASRVRGNGCPYCAGRYPIVGETDLATTHSHFLSCGGWYGEIVEASSRMVSGTWGSTACDVFG